MMKGIKFISIMLVAVLGAFLLTGCAPKREEVSFKGEEGSITFNVKEDGGYKISTNKDDFRTSREQAVLIGKDFRIGIEFDDNYGYFFNSKWDAVKKARKDRDEFKEVTYSDIKGIQYFYSGYMYYEILLPIEGAKDHFLTLTVRGLKDNEESAKAAIKNEEVQDVLNHITTIKAD